MPAKNLLEEVSFPFKSDMGLFRSLALGDEHAGIRTKKQSGWLQGLPMRTVDGIGDPKNSGENTEFFFLFFGEVLIPTMKGGGGAFPVVACDQGDELPFPAGKVFPGMFADQSGGLLMMGFFRCRRAPTRVMQKRSGD